MGRVLQMIGQVADSAPSYQSAFTLAAVVPTPLWLVLLALFVPSLVFNILMMLNGLARSAALIIQGVDRTYDLRDEGHSLLLAGPSSRRDWWPGSSCSCWRSLAGGSTELIDRQLFIEKPLQIADDAFDGGIVLEIEPDFSCRVEDIALAVWSIRSIEAFPVLADTLAAREERLEFLRCGFGRARSPSARQMRGETPPYTWQVAPVYRAGDRR